MKYAGKDVPRYRYNIGTRVHVTALKGNPVGRVTRHEYRGKGYGWHYRVDLLDSPSSPKYWSAKSLRKVRSDLRRR